MVYLFFTVQNSGDFFSFFFLGTDIRQSKMRIGGEWYEEVAEGLINGKVDRTRSSSTSELLNIPRSAPFVSSFETSSLRLPPANGFIVFFFDTSFARTPPEDDDDRRRRPTTPTTTKTPWKRCGPARPPIIRSQLPGLGLSRETRHSASNLGPSRVCPATKETTKYLQSIVPSRYTPDISRKKEPSPDYR